MEIVREVSSKSRIVDVHKINLWLLHCAVLNLFLDHYRREKCEKSQFVGVISFQVSINFIITDVDFHFFCLI
jgi:hypothetical protein